MKTTDITIKLTEVNKKVISSKNFGEIITRIKNEIGINEVENDFSKIADYLYLLKKLKDNVKSYFKPIKEPIKEKLLNIENEEKQIVSTIEKEEDYYRDFINNSITKSINDNQIVEKRYEGIKAYITMVKDIDYEITDIKSLVTAIVNGDLGESAWSIIEIKKSKLSDLIKTLSELNIEIPGVLYKHKASMRLIPKK